MHNAREMTHSWHSKSTKKKNKYIVEWDQKQCKWHRHRVILIVAFRNDPFISEHKYENKQWTYTHLVNSSLIICLLSKPRNMKFEWTQTTHKPHSFIFFFSSLPLWSLYRKSKKKKTQFFIKHFSLSQSNCTYTPSLNVLKFVMGISFVEYDAKLW